MTRMETNATKPIKLTRKDGHWTYRGLRIERREWCIPCTCVSFRLIDAKGKVALEEDRLSDLRSAIADYESTGDFDQFLKEAQ
jgi:hypothetical protein